jgi:hypothetical protein
MDIKDVPLHGYVYRLLVGVSGDYYVGSTTQPLRNRLAFHRTASGYENAKDRRLYTKVVEVGGWEGVKVAILEQLVENKVLREREKSYINFDDPFCLNERRPVRTEEEHKEVMKQYYKDKKEHLQGVAKKYYEENKERCLERSKEYYRRRKEEDPEWMETLRGRQREAVKRCRERKKLEAAAIALVVEGVVKQTTAAAGAGAE